VRIAAAVVGLLAVLGAGLAGGYALRGSDTVAITTTATTTVNSTVTKSVPVRPPMTIYVPQAGGDVEYMPEVIYVGVSGGGYTGVRWRTYGKSPAIADANVPHNDCIPNCAAGKTTHTDVTLHLTRIRPCKGVPAYGEAQIVKSSDPAEEGSITDLAALCAEGD
jgi:hypothetical protein